MSFTFTNKEMINYAVFIKDIKDLDIFLEIRNYLDISWQKDEVF